MAPNNDYTLGDNCYRNQLPGTHAITPMVPAPSGTQPWEIIDARVSRLVV